MVAWLSMYTSFCGMARRVQMDSGDAPEGGAPGSGHFGPNKASIEITDQHDVAQLMEKADAALYHAKASGRSNIQVYDPGKMNGKEA